MYIDVPVDFEDDAMAALRYSVEQYRRNSKIQFAKMLPRL
nr:MAG TPA: hypothetical protein [Caudoviricetes sp.]